jgi:hypothetical protein
MATSFNNIPYGSASQLDSTLQAFDNYQSQPFELHAGTFNSMIGFFTSRGFEKEAAESITVVIMKQAQRDNYNPMSILDTLNGLDSVNISALVSEILNYSRYKTSMLGYALVSNPNSEVTRNIVGAPIAQTAGSNEEIVTPVPVVRTYSISPSSSSVNEGASVSFTVYSNVPDNTILDWDLVGVQSEDIVGSLLSGTVTIIGGQGIITITVATDTVLYEAESLLLRIVKATSVLATASVIIIDTSIELKADYIVIEYTFDTGLDLDTRTRLAVPVIGSYLGWGQSPGTNDNIIQWGGDNTGIGTEAVLFNVINFKAQNPTVANIIIDCRAQWYNQVGTTPAGLKVTLFTGGAMVKNGYTWTNPTANKQQIFDNKLTLITLKSTSSASIGQRIATLKYNVVSGTGSLDTTDVTVYP